jgi:hypothetical protein
MALWQIKGGLLMEEINATRIKETIIDLTDDLKTEEQLWEAYKAINKGLMYLSAKHTMLEVKNKD